MEIKSRYEIISELEQQKIKLLNAKANMGFTEATMQMAIEEAEKNLKDFLSGKAVQLANIEDQIASIDKSLNRLNTQKK